MIKAPQGRPRAYARVDVAGGATSFRVLLDDHPLRSPAGAVVGLPTRALAESVATEWRSQTTTPDLERMPATRLAFTAVDRGDAAREGLVVEVARFAANDLICYLADAPRALVERQGAQWGPWREWARLALDLDLPVFTGIMPGEVSASTRRRAIDLAAQLRTFELIGVVAACGLFGSAILAFALARGALTGDAAHALARLDEVWQESQWGQDPEASTRASAREAEAGALDLWFRALRDKAIPGADELC